MAAASLHFKSDCAEELSIQNENNLASFSLCYGVTSLSAVKHSSSTVTQLQWLHTLHCKQQLLSLNSVQLFINFYSMTFSRLKKLSFQRALLRHFIFDCHFGSSFQFQVNDGFNKCRMKCKGEHVIFFISARTVSLVSYCKQNNFLIAMQVV